LTLKAISVFWPNSTPAAVQVMLKRHAANAARASPYRTDSGCQRADCAPIAHKFINCM